MPRPPLDKRLVVLRADTDEPGKNKRTRDVIRPRDWSDDEAKYRAPAYPSTEQMVQACGIQRRWDHFVGYNGTWYGRPTSKKKKASAVAGNRRKTNVTEGTVRAPPSTPHIITRLMYGMPPAFWDTWLKRMPDVFKYLHGHLRRRVRQCKHEAIFDYERGNVDGQIETMQEKIRSGGRDQAHLKKELEDLVQVREIHDLAFKLWSACTRHFCRDTTSWMVFNADECKNVGDVTHRGDALRFVVQLIAACRRQSWFMEGSAHALKHECDGECEDELHKGLRAIARSGLERDGKTRKHQIVVYAEWSKFWRIAAAFVEMELATHHLRLGKMPWTCWEASGKYLASVAGSMMWIACTTPPGDWVNPDPLQEWQPMHCYKIRPNDSGLLLIQYIIRCLAVLITGLSKSADMSDGGGTMADLHRRGDSVGARMGACLAQSMILHDRIASSEAATLEGEARKEWVDANEASLFKDLKLDPDTKAKKFATKNKGAKANDVLCMAWGEQSETRITRCVLLV